MNAEYDPKPLDLAGAMGTDLGSLKVIGTWWSKKASRFVKVIMGFVSLHASIVCVNQRLPHVSLQTICSG